MPDRENEMSVPPDLGPFADALRQLAPQPPELSRDALLFAAGKAAATPGRPPWLWPSATAFFAAVSLVLAAFLASPSDREVQTVVVYVPQPAPAAPVEPAPPPPEPVAKPKARSADDSEAARMAQVRKDVLRWGVDMLPESKADARPPALAADDLRRWLELPPDVLAHPGLLPKKAAPKSGEEDDK